MKVVWALFCSFFVLSVVFGKTISIPISTDEDGNLVTTLGVGHPQQKMKFAVFMRNEQYNQAIMDNENFIFTSPLGKNFFNETLSSTIKITKENDFRGCQDGRVRGHFDYDSLHIGHFAAPNWRFFAVDKNLDCLDLYDRSVIDKSFHGTLWFNLPIPNPSNHRSKFLPLSLFDSGKISKPYVKPVLKKDHQPEFVLGDVIDNSINIKWQNYEGSVFLDTKAMIGTKKLDTRANLSFSFWHVCSLLVIR
eukprot:TRINITY_DN3074_c0_g1_i1.p1 TRINITY_DN3074_c0_g1~~TRINITY_DN3074_c0_g1_i1.p1  ORF type:complete len:249 (-),score=38.87 TRINITY_DN3074_c0_g1_i1:378-1124(-)